MAWETSDRKSQLPADWGSILVPFVRQRDGGRCQWPREGRAGGICGAPGQDVDHRIHRDDHRPEALWLLCRWHHTQKTQQESAEARRALLDKTRHPVERAPGIL